MLTEKAIKALRPTASRYRTQDSAGLAIEVMPSGLKSWRFRAKFDGKQAELSLGRWPVTTLTAARRERDRLLAGISRGESRAALDNRGRFDGQTLREFGCRWITDIASKRRKDVRPVMRQLDRDVWPVMGHRGLSAIRVADVRDLIHARRDAGFPHAAAELRNTLKRLFDYAQACGLVESNPAAAVQLRFVATRSSRDRYLSESEARLLWRRLEEASGTMPAALRLLMLTLARKSELRLATWMEFDLDRAIWEIPAEHSKTRQAQIVYLSQQAVDILRAIQSRRGSYYASELAFPTPGSRYTPLSPGALNQALRRFSKGFPRFTVHDLRRTGATHLSEMGFDPEWVEVALNHKLKGVRGVYNRARYGDQRRTMLQGWADWLEAKNHDK